MAAGFVARLTRAYRMQDQLVLVLAEGYEGDMETGDEVEVALTDGRNLRLAVINLAWGSAFRAESPPLTLVVEGDGGVSLELLPAGAGVRGV